jgi:hypothetical protein
MRGNFAILNPCAKKWTDLPGNGRARFCGKCQTHVHAIAEYSTDEWDRLWRESNGQVCGFLSGGSTAPPRSRRAILIGALLTVASPLFAASGRVRFRVINLNGDPLPKTNIELLDRDNKTVQSVETDDSGQAVLIGTPLGDSRFGLEDPGLQKRQLTLTFRNDKEVKVEVHLWPPIVGTIISVKPKPPRKRDGWLVY